MRVSPAFSRKPDHELERLSTDALIAYLHDARAAGDEAAASRALAFMAYGHWRNVERRVAMKVPPGDVEDVTAEIVASAIASAFHGRSAGEFGAWLSTITQRRIADHFRRRPPVVGEDPGGAEPAVAGEEGAIEVRDAVERVLASMSEDHRAVVELLVFDRRPASEAVARIAGMTEANAHQVVSRFRRALRRQLEGDT